MAQIMEIRYYRDLNHNYMIVDKETDRQDGYQYHMLKTNQITGILPCTVRRINNDIFLYYCIDSKLNLSSCYEIKKMQMKELRSLLEEIHKTIEHMREYLLDESEIVFNIKAIYKELTSEKTFFALYPFGNSDICFTEFAEQILTITDQEDENAISVAYRLCELAQNRELAVREIVEILLKEEKQETEPVESTTYQENIRTEEWIEETENISEKNESEKEKTKKGNNLLFAAAFFAVFVTLFCLRKFFNLTYRENIISLTVMVVTLLLTVVSLYYEIKKRKKETTEERDDTDIGMNENNTSDYNIPAKCNSYCDAEPQKGIAEKKETEEIFGETIVLNPEVLQRISRLYSRNTDASMQIGFEHLPLTVGKMVGRVDHILNHSSISRIHARISKNEQNQICLRDLNSTNGTFRNGIRLHPEEEIIINPGDEIGFGTLIFDYR